MRQREIPKIPSLPLLSLKTIKLLTELCFRENDTDIGKAETLFVFGTAVSIPELAHAVKELLRNHTFKTLIITGGNDTCPDAVQHPFPESEMIYQAIKDVVPQTTHVILEKKSQNTYENVFLAMPMIKDPVSSLCFITKNFHSQRAFLTLKRFFPNIPIFQKTFEPIYPAIGIPLTQSIWWSNPVAASRVWGEYLRIKTYGERGDLPLGNVAKIVHDIDVEVKV